MIIETGRGKTCKTSNTIITIAITTMHITCKQKTRRREAKRRKADLSCVHSFGKPVVHWLGTNATTL
jgi:hypothetical protein